MSDLPRNIEIDPIDPRLLLSGYLENRLNEEEFSQLVRWIHADRENAKAFMRHCMLVEHIRDELHWDDVNELPIEDAGSGGSLILRSFHELLEDEQKQPTVVVDISDEMARRASEAKARELAATDRWRRLTGDQHDNQAQTRHYVIPRPVFYGTIVAVIAVIVAIGSTFFDDEPARTGTDQQTTIAPIVAHLESSTQLKWGPGLRPENDAAMRVGAYDLQEGIMRIRFDDGAIVTVESPSKFSLIDPTIMKLARGHIVGRVDDGEGEGFVVETPAARFVDIGTEFGVAVSHKNDSELHVFEGRVEAAARTKQGVSGVATTFHAKEGVRVESDDRVLQRIDADPNTFTSTRHVPIAIHSTGVGAVEGAVDKYWRITAIDGKELEFAEPPVITQPWNPAPRVRYMKNDPATSQWITIDNPSKSPETIQFETTFDIEGFDVSTVVLYVRFIADNRITNITLNDESIPVPPHSDSPPFDTFTEVSIDKYFVTGRNTLVFLIEDNVAKDGERKLGGNNWHGLRVELSAQGRMTWDGLRASHDE